MASPTTRHRPRAVTVLTTAFLAGAAAAVVLNQALDVHLSQRKPVVESEPIFVAMRSLPVGAPVTVWDVALKNWPKAMLPTQALRIGDSFEGMLLKTPLQEGQPLLSAQLVAAADQQGSTGTAAVIGGSDSMVVIDDRTRVQVSWPAAVPAQPPAPPQAALAPTPREVTAVPAGSVDVTPLPITVKEPVETDRETLAATVAERDAVPQADPPPTVVVSAPAPLSTDLPPVVPQPEPPVAQPAAQPEPSSVGSLVFPPTAAPAQQASAASRHLVIPERIAVMIDEVTATESMRKPSPAEATPAMRPVTTRASNASPRVGEPAPSPRALEPSKPPLKTAQPKARSTQAAGGPAARPQTSRTPTMVPATTRPQAARTQPASPRTSLRKPMSEQGAGRTSGVPPQRPETQGSPRLPQPPSSARPAADVRSKGMQDRQTQASPKTSTDDPTVPEAESARGGSMFPRVSARLEQVGEEFNRWRAGFGGDSSPK
jgi:hypothetical protein